MNMPMKKEMTLSELKKKLSEMDNSEMRKLI